MMKLNINGKEYKIKYGFNSFCDTDLMDRVRTMAEMFSEENVQNDEDATGIGRLKELFSIVRELIYVGCEKYNPMDSLQAVGDLLDEYMDEDTEEERGLLHLFQDLTGELFNEGFLADVTGQQQTGMEDGVKTPTDHMVAQN